MSEAKQNGMSETQRIYIPRPVNMDGRWWFHYPNIGGLVLVLDGLVWCRWDQQEAPSQQERREFLAMSETAAECERLRQSNAELASLVAAVADAIESDLDSAVRWVVGPVWEREWRRKLDCMRRLIANVEPEPATTKVVVFVKGGNVQGVFSDTPGIQAIVVDYDNEREGDPRCAFCEVDVDAELIRRTELGTELTA